LICSTEMTLYTEIAIQANAEDIRVASAWLEKVCVEYRVPDEQLYRLDLCLNEVLANIMDHGRDQALFEPIKLRFFSSQNCNERKAAVTVSDAGVEFDPLSVSPNPGAKELATAQPGGLGLLMLHGLSDELYYSYQDAHNHLTFAVHWLET
jgi:serine/threonine-protein kinase RsbW